MGSRLFLSAQQQNWASHQGRVSWGQVDGVILLKLANHVDCMDWRNFIPNKTQVRALLDQKSQAVFDGLVELTADKPELRQWLLEVMPDELEWITDLSIKAAELLTQRKGPLHLQGLCSISDTAALALSKHEGLIYLHGTQQISQRAAGSLAANKGFLSLKLDGFLSDIAAEALAQHTGGLSLLGITDLSDAAANYL